MGWEIGRENREICSWSTPTHLLNLPLSNRSDQFGQLAKELAEPYYLYGKALLELARAESTVLGSGIPGEQGRDQAVTCSAMSDFVSSEVPQDKASSSDEEEEEEGEEDGEGREGEAEDGAEGKGEEKEDSSKS